MYTYICIYVYTYKCFSQKDLRGFVTTQEDYAKFTERQQNELKKSVLLLYSLNVVEVSSEPQEFVAK